MVFKTGFRIAAGLLMALFYVALFEPWLPGSAWSNPWLGLAELPRKRAGKAVRDRLKALADDGSDRTWKSS